MPDRQAGHAERIVRDATQLLGALARREAAPSIRPTNPTDARLPEARAALAGVHRGPVHHVGRALVRTEEEDLLLLVEVDDWLLDARRGALEEQVEDSVDVLAEDDDRFGAEAGLSAVGQAATTHSGRIVPLEPPSGMSCAAQLDRETRRRTLFLSACVLASA